MLTYITKFGSFAMKPDATQGPVIAVLDHRKLHRLMVDKVANELQFLSNDCYYPRVADIYKELLIQTQTNEAAIQEWAKDRYTLQPWMKKSPLLHDPKTSLLLLIIQNFLENNDISGATAAINLLSLRFYTGLMHRFFKKYCNPDYFRSALNRVSHNHLFSQKQTIGNALLHLANEILKRYKSGLAEGDVQSAVETILKLRGRISQSLRSFANKYFEVAQGEEVTRIEDEESPEKQTIEKKLRLTANRISKEVTIYGLIDHDARKTAQQLTRQNQKLAIEYVKTLSNTKYAQPLELAIFLFLKYVKEKNAKSKIDFLNMSKDLMAIKVSKKPVFYKKTLIQIHDQIIMDLGYGDYFEKLSIQSKGISRRFLSYYISALVYNFLKQ